MMNIWLDGMLGLILGDALGCPVQFLSRGEIRNRKQGPVTGMEGYGTYLMPPGTWTDDGSMALASLDSILTKGKIHPRDTMDRFVAWDLKGAYTQYGQAFDQGMTCTNAIWKYNDTGDWRHCGVTGEYANGNGALMRILPVCLYYIKHADQCTVDEALKSIHVMAGLTHNHLRNKIACGLYFFMAKAIVDNKEEDLLTCMKKGMAEGLAFYRKDEDNLDQLAYFHRLFDLEKFAKTRNRDIKSTGYVVDSIEAAVWCLITTKSFEECLLKAVNLGFDTDTVAAIAGGLAGLFYGFDAMPQEWIDEIVKYDYVVSQCRKVNELD